MTISSVAFCTTTHATMNVTITRSSLGDIAMTLVLSAQWPIRTMLRTIMH